MAEPSVINMEGLSDLGVEQKLRLIEREGLGAEIPCARERLKPGIRGYDEEAVDYFLSDTAHVRSEELAGGTTLSVRRCGRGACSAECTLVFTNGKSLLGHGRVLLDHSLISAEACLE